LFYIASDQKLLAVPIRADATIEVGTPVPLFQSNPVGGAAYVPGSQQQYDVTADGQRFLMIVEAEGARAASPFTVVLNWQAGLKR
jgi:hypothetical protein